MDKSPDAFRTIREVSEWLETPAHVLRFWESKFSQIRPVKRAGGRRYYRPKDMLLLGGIKHLLHDEGHTIKRVQRMLGTDGVKAVAAFSQPLTEGDIAEPANKSAPPNTVPSFVSSRSRPDVSVRDLSAIEDAEILPSETLSAPEIPDVDVPADPADREFETLPLPVSARILSGKFRPTSDQTPALRVALDRLTRLRNRNAQQSLL